MKKIILTLICLFCFSVTCFANEQEVVTSFKKVVNELCLQEQQNFLLRVIYISEGKGGYWCKFKKSNLQSEFDIQKTDSLISPYKGILLLKSDTINYCSNDNPRGRYATKEEAEQADMQWIRPATFKCKYIYMYQDEKWVLKDVEIVDI